MNELLNFLSNGLLGLSGWQVALVALIFVQLTIMSVTLYLHRAQAHRAVDLSPILTHPIRMWLWLTTGMSTKAWVAIHRKHHAKCETEEDPHSPVHFGLKRLVMDGAALYRKEAKNKETLDQYGKGTPDDWMERNIYMRSLRNGILLMLLADFLMFGIVGITVWAIQMIWIPFWAAGFINGVGHWWGYRNFKTPDTSTNLWPIGFWIGGEELHNNHHAFPGSAKFSVKPWEFDIGWMYLRIFSMLGLAKIRKVAPKPSFETGKTGIDAESIKALLANRLYVMADYGRKVIKPLLKERPCTDNACEAKVRKVVSNLRRDEEFLDQETNAAFDELLNSTEELKTVYKFQQSLQSLIEKAHASQEAMLQALTDWVHQAEQTGIKALQDFARTLSTYRMKATSASTAV